MRIFVILIFIISGLAANNCYAQESLRHTIIVDAGSSGSRLFLFSYYQDKTGQLPKNIRIVLNKKVKNGLEEIPKSALNNYLAKLFDEVNAKVPTKQQEVTPLYLFATAGMRLLSQPQQQKTYKVVRTWLAKNTHFVIRDVKTITGQDEGIFDWLAVNYLNGSLTSKKTVGVLDMGGASTEIAFSDKMQSANTKLITLGKKKFNVFSRSYLGLGENVTLDQYMNDAACFAKGYKLSNGSKGIGDFNRCVYDTLPIINSVHYVSREISAKIPPDMEFYAISGFAFVTETLKIEPEALTINSLTNDGKKFCAKPWENLVKRNPNNPYLFKDCFNAAYFTALLSKGYKFSSQRRFIAKTKIRHQDIDWNIGALIYVSTNS